MIAKLFALLVLLSLLLTATDVSALYRTENINSQNQPEITRLIVKFEPQTGSQINITGKSNSKSGVISIDNLNSKYSVKSFMSFLPPKIKMPSGRIFQNVYIVELSDTDEVQALIEEYKNRADVEYAEPDYAVELYDIPNDSLFPYQWNLNNSGQEHHHVVRHWGSYNDELLLVNGTVDSDIDALEVYENPADQTNTVIVAIIDTGADMDHPDLMDNIWTNTKEIADNGLDDDNNGYIDDIVGWDFAGSFDPDDPGDNDPTDAYGHGTHCAGIVAAVSNNEIGITGINPHAQIMALNFDPLPLITRIARAIIYAADNGADVVNMSFGTVFSSDLINEAIEYSHSRGVVLCAATGNSGLEEMNYPAAHPLTIAVGASNDSDQVTPFSTYGEHLSLVAPGLSILSLRSNNTDMYASSYPYEPTVHVVDDIYYMASGTSMACPHVVGAASWIRSVSPGLNPTRVKEILESSADDITDPYSVGWNLTGYDKYSGYGRLNLKNALDMTPRRRAKIVYPYANSIDSGYILIHGYADGDDFSNWSLDYGEGDNPTIWINLDSSDQPKTNNAFISWDSHGLAGQYTIRLSVDNENFAYTTIYIANESVAEIIDPMTEDTISNYIAVKGNAYCPDFSFYRLDYKIDTINAVWESLDSGSIPVYDDVIGRWFLEELSEAEYSLRLTVYADGIPLNADSIAVQILSIFSTDQAWRQKLNGFPAIISNYGDIDGDNVNEIIVGTSNGISIFNLDGTIKENNLPNIPLNNYLVPLAVGNLDDDGIDDFVAIGYDPPFVYGFPSSDTTFKCYTGVYPAVYNYYRGEHEFPKIALRDIDNDDMDEIFVFMFDGSMSQTFLFESNGQEINRFDYYSETFLVDLNDDGTDELYAANQTYSLLRQIDYLTGETLDSLLIQEDGSDFRCLGMSAFDIDNDNLHELILYGFYLNAGYAVYAFDYGLQLIDGWPLDMGLDDYVVPTNPIFGDLDGDGEPEMISSFFDIDIGYVMAWNLDGSSFISGNEGGLFTATPEPAVLNMLLLADIDGDYQTDIIGCANNDIFNTYKAQRFYAWNSEAEILPGFPLIASTDTWNSDRFTPTLGDIDNDDLIEMIMPTPDSSQLYINYPASYNRCNSPVPFWRYNRKMNNIGPLPCGQTAVMEDDPKAVPKDYKLSQNFPNPFNPTTTITYSLPTRADVTINVYDLLGRKINTLTSGSNAAGEHEIVWNGRDYSGEKVSSGIYFYQIKADDFVDSKKMVLLK